jgi:hypothetical protein
MTSVLLTIRLCFHHTPSWRSEASSLFVRPAGLHGLSVFSAQHLSFLESDCYSLENDAVLTSRRLIIPRKSEFE